MQAELEAGLLQVLQIENETGQNIENAPSLAAAVTVKAQVSFREVRLRDPSGHEILSTAQAMVRPDTVVTTKSLVTLPDGTTTRVLRVDSVPHPQTGAIDHLRLLME